MKTLIINGSPRKGGDTATLIAAYRQGLEGEVQQLDAFSLAIPPCTDCCACRTLHRCMKADRMAEVEAAIEESDRVVIAAPVWLGSLPAPLLALGSRLQHRWYCLETLPQKQGAILLAAGGSGDAEGARRSAELMLRMMGVKGAVPMAACLHTDASPASQNQEALNQAFKIAKEGV